MDFTRSSSSGQLGGNLNRNGTGNGIRSASSTSSLRTHSPSSPSSTNSTTARSRPIPIRFAGERSTSASSQSNEAALVSQSMPEKPRVGSLMPDSSFGQMTQLELPPSPNTQSYIDFVDEGMDSNPNRTVAASAPVRERSLSLSLNTTHRAVLHQMRVNDVRQARAPSYSGMSTSFKQVLGSLHEGVEEDQEEERYTGSLSSRSPVVGSVILSSVLREELGDPDVASLNDATLQFGELDLAGSVANAPHEEDEEDQFQME